MEKVPPDQLIANTREAAIALMEDFHFLTELCEERDTRPVDLRHASAVLRRWLVEDQLNRVASPRIGRMNLLAIDNNPIYRAVRNGDIISFASGGAAVHGIYMAASIVSSGRRSVELRDFHPDIQVPLSIKTFLRQNVIYFDGKWYSRQQIIKFVANADHGVHGHGAIDDWEKSLAKFRNEVSVTLETDQNGEEMPSITWQQGGSVDGNNLSNYDPSRINGILLEVLATIEFLTKSPDLIKLVDIITNEVGFQRTRMK